MRLIIHALVALLVAAPAAAQEAPAPQCRAILDESQLLTTIRFTDGSSVEGPWRVIENETTPLHDGRRGLRVAAMLDRIVEVDAKGRRTPTPFPDPIRTTFEGPDEQHLVEQAAQVWCLTVLKVHGDVELPFRTSPAAQGRRATHVAR